MSTDPFAASVDSVGSPYAHAFTVAQVSLIGGDVNLPCVTSALRMQGVGRSRVKVTLQSGEIVTFYALNDQTIDVRAVKLHQEVQDANGFLPPDSVIALW